MISLLEQGKKIIILGQVPRMVGLDRKCEMKAAEEEGRGLSVSTEKLPPGDQRCPAPPPKKSLTQNRT